MSNEAISWSLQQLTGSSSSRQLLMVLADAASDSPSTSRFGRKWDKHHAYLSIAAMCERTLQERKTVIANLKKLEASGFLVRAGTDGITNQSVVYRLPVGQGPVPETPPVPKLGPVPKAEPVGGDEPVPVLPATSAVFTHDQCRFDAPPVPKTGHESQGTQVDPKKEPNLAGPVEPAADLLGDHVDQQALPKKEKQTKPPSKTALVLAAYRTAYEARYSIEPLDNAKTRSQLSQFLQRVSVEEAPAIAKFYVEHQEPFYVRSAHPVGLLLKDAEKLRMEWKTGHKSFSAASPARNPARHSNFDHSNYREEV